MTIEKPTVEEIRKYLEKWDTLDNYAFGSVGGLYYIHITFAHRRDKMNSMQGDTKTRNLLTKPLYLTYGSSFC